MRNIKKWITVLGAVALMGTNVMGVCAAPFDANWYATQNPDVVAVLGTDAVALEQHYNTFGKAEGRTANAMVDSTVTNNETAMSAVFDAAYYATQNPDVVAVFGTDAMSLYTHYISVGIYEGRSGSATFNAAAYKAANPDLAAAFGDDLAAYVNHYATVGQAEGRSAGISSVESDSKGKNSESNDPYARFKSSSSSSSHKSSSSSSSEDSSNHDEAVTEEKEFEYTIEGISGPDTIKVGESAEYKLEYSVGEIPEGCKLWVSVESGSSRDVPVEIDYDRNDDNWMRVNAESYTDEILEIWGIFILYDENSENKFEDYLMRKDIYKDVKIVASEDSSNDDEVVTEEKEFEYTIEGISGPDTIKVGESAEYELEYSAGEIPEGCKLYVSVEDYNRVRGTEIEYDDNNSNWMRVNVEDDADTEDTLTIWGIFILYDEDSEDMEEDYLIRKDIYKDVTIVASDSAEEPVTE